MKWTNEEIEKLKEMYLKKMPVSEVAVALGRTYKATMNKAYALKITRETKYTEEEIQYVRDNYKSYNLREVADYLGREKTNICRLAKELGLDRTKRKSENPKTYRDENGVPHYVGWVRKTTEEIAETRSAIMKRWHGENEHPKGMLGKHHSNEYRKELARRIKENWANMTPEKLENRFLKQRASKVKNGTLNPMINSSNPYSRTKSGKRADLNNTFFRSSWEANMARYYNYIGVKWQFEPKTFVFNTIKRGSVSYTPDFYLPEKDRWVEVKGWMDEKSKTKLKRFEKYYPEEYAKLELITGKEYKEFEKFGRLINGWEH